MEAPSATWRTGSGRQRNRIGRPRIDRPENAAEQTALFVEEALDRADQTFPDLWEHLTDVGQRSFVGELLGAAFSHEPPPTEAIQGVIDAWYATLVLRQSPDYDEAAASRGRTAAELGERVYTTEELHDRLTG